MSAFDIVVLLIAAAALVMGYAKGFIVQLGSVAGIIVGILACRLFGNSLTAMFIGEGATATQIYVTGIFANVILFIIGFMAAWLGARLLKIVANALRLSVVDRIGGALFSLFKWMFLLSLALNLWQAIAVETDIATHAKFLAGKPVSAIINLAPEVIGSQTADSILSTIRG